MRTCIILFLWLLICNGTSGQGDNVRDKVSLIYRSQLGVKEATGHNDGTEVEKYLAYVGFKAGAPWCAAFVCWVYGQGEVDNPKTAWAPSLFPDTRTIYIRDLYKKTLPQKADLFGIYYSGPGRVCHVGFIEAWGERMILTVEGNTNDAGSSEGTRVAMKRRCTRTIYKVSRYVKD